jgi:hypothetical protein
MKRGNGIMLGSQIHEMLTILRIIFNGVSYFECGFVGVELWGV